jgi:putative acetyltransferase
MNVATIVRPEEPGDYAQIREMTIPAFKAAYGTGEAEADLIERLRAQPDHDPALALVAVQGALVVGHILFSPVIIRGEAGEWPALCLAPLGVRIGYQRQGIGSALLRAGLARARERGHSRLVLSGDPAYYGRFGFGDAQSHGLRDDLGTPPPHFLALALAEGALAGVSGLVCYSPPFDVFRPTNS